jgi:hypothetical protein
VIRAARGRKWPGDAKVRVNLVWVRRGEYAGNLVLNDAPVEHISATLGSGAEKQEAKALSSPDLCQ